MAVALALAPVAALERLDDCEVAGEVPRDLDGTFYRVGRHARPVDFDGKWNSQTFTAHPKLDPVTGELVAFGYEATGAASDDLFICTLDKSGQVRNEVRLKVPYVSVPGSCR